MPHIRIDSEGSGPPLVLVHSLLTDARAFDTVAPRLASRFGLHRVWLPGFGASEPLPNPSPTLFDIAEALAEALEAAGVRGAEFVVLDKCGHCPPLESPAAFCEAVEKSWPRHRRAE